MEAFKIIGIWIAAACVVVGLSIGGYQLYWHLAKSNANNQYDVNTHTQGYQAALIQQERDRVQAWNTATDPGQKAQLGATFCAVYADLTQIPTDLNLAHTQICH